jgi:hypothetical protein
VTRDARRALLWLPAAALLLAFGFLAWLAIGAQIAGRSLGPAETAQLQTAFVLYARFVLFKGLLPALALALALFPLLERVFALERRGAWASALVIVAASAVASTAVAGLVLPSNLWGDFSVARYAGARHFAETCAEMTAGVAAALVVARWLVHSRARLPVWLSGVAIACIAAGFWLPKPMALPAKEHASAPPHVEPAQPPGATADATPAPAAPAQPAPDYPVTTLPGRIARDPGRRAGEPLERSDRRARRPPPPRRSTSATRSRIIPRPHSRGSRRSACCSSATAISSSSWSAAIPSSCSRGLRPASTSSAGSSPTPRRSPIAARPPRGCANGSTIRPSRTTSRAV